MLRFLKRLEERGWVQRADCPTDRRGQIARLTEAGFAALTAAAPGHVAAVREHVIDRLTAEQVAQLETIFATVIEGLEPGKCDAARAAAAAEVA